jgi:hypothetical protein
MKLVTAIVAGIGTSILVTVPSGFLAGFILGTLKSKPYISWAAVIIELSAIAVGVLAGRLVYRHLKERSATAPGAAPGSSATEMPLPAQQT